jgi:branched-chain amino acid transport system substrate-binding protein
VKKLAASRADVFLNISTPKAGAQSIAAVAQSGWKPLHILNNVAASKTQVIKPVGYQYAQGILSSSYFKTPEDPQWANDEAMKSYREGMAKYAPDGDPLDTYSVYGWLAGETLVETVKKMTAPTRQALMDSARNLDIAPALLLPGIKVKTSGGSDPYPIEAMQMSRFEGEDFKLIGSVIEAPSA